VLGPGLIAGPGPHLPPSERRFSPVICSVDLVALGLIGLPFVLAQFLQFQLSCAALQAGALLLFPVS
jgi:hypothetical protein